MTHFFRLTEFIIAIMKSLDFGWLWHVNVGPVVTTNVPFWLGMLIIWEAMTMWGQGVYWKSLFFLLNFAVNPKLLGKKKLFIVTSNIIFFIFQILFGMRQWGFLWLRLHTCTHRYICFSFSKNKIKTPQCSDQRSP